MKIVVFGKSWELADTDVPAIIHDASRQPWWEWMLGCEGCKTFCFTFHPCKCCAERKGAIGGPHDKVLEVQRFLAKVKEKRDAA